MPESSPSYRQVRGALVHFHLLRDATGLYLIDAGFLGAVSRLEKILTGLGCDFGDIRAVILTHGHLDHTYNVAEIKRRSGCPVFAPAADRDHVAGEFAYRGLSRLCGIAESLGRKLPGYQVPEVDHWFEPGQKLDLWDGLEVVHLPGHTAGHCGFLSERHRLLFAGDLFSNYLGFAKLPPPWFNTDSAEIHNSIRAAAALDIDRVALNHSRSTTCEANFKDLQRLAARI